MYFSQMASSNYFFVVVVWLFIVIPDHGNSEQWPFSEGEEYTMAHVNITYTKSDEQRVQASELGKFGSGRVDSASGILVHVRSRNSSSNHGCDANYENEIPTVPWIALVRRGRCNFDDKLEAAFLNNASGIIVYNNKDDGLQKMTLRNKYRDKLVAVFITRAKGEQLAALSDSGTEVAVLVSVGPHYTYRLTNINRTSVMFVSISFIVLMMISLAWLVFYYIQRFRYLNAKDRLSRELTNAAQRALAKIPTSQLKTADKEILDAECCAVCIEPYKVSDNLRILPCKHEFHITCVDPWLLEHRTCPMCKMDILKHYGYVFTGSQESIINMDLDAPMYVEVDTRPNNPVPSISASNGASSPVESQQNAGTDEPVVVPESTSLSTTARSQATNTLPLGSRCTAQASETKSSLRFWSLPRGTPNDENSTTELSNPSLASEELDEKEPAGKASAATASA